MWLILLLLGAPLAAFAQDVVQQAVPVTQTASYNPRQVRAGAHLRPSSRVAWPYLDVQQPYDCLGRSKSPDPAAELPSHLQVQLNFPVLLPCCCTRRWTGAL